MPTISRRRLILGGASAAGLALAFPLWAGARETITVEEFRALSARLTGASLDRSRRGRFGQAARRLSLDGARARSRPSRRRSWSKAGPLADDIVAAWYSGSYDTGTGLASIGLTNALVWDALDFTKPSGFCGGLTGYWGDAPRT